MTIDTILLHGLTPSLDRVVLNETGLNGEFDWTLEWDAEQVPLAGDVRELPPAGALGPSIVTAVEEQLGLKLESARRPVEVLVIDSVERPTPD